MEVIDDDPVGDMPTQKRKRMPKPNLPRGRSADPNLLAETIALKHAQRTKVELQNAQARSELLPAKAVEAEWAGILRDVRAGMLALPSRLQQRLPHLAAHDVATIDREIRDALASLGGQKPVEHTENVPEAFSIGK